MPISQMPRKELEDRIYHFRRYFAKKNPGLPCDSIAELASKLSPKPQDTETTSYRLGLVKRDCGCVAGNLHWIAQMARGVVRSAKCDLGISSNAVRERLRDFRERGVCPDTIREFLRMPDAARKHSRSNAGAYRALVGARIGLFEIVELQRHGPQSIFTLRCARCGTTRRMYACKLLRIARGKRHDFTCKCKPISHYRKNSSCAKHSVLMRQRMRDAFRAMCRGLGYLDPQSREIVEASVSQWTIYAGTEQTIHARLECWIKGIEPETLL